MGERICAVVVTYHPTSEDVAHLADIRPQVDLAVLVDNGSTPEERGIVHQASRQHNCHVIENGANLGIAAALNVGIRWAISQGCRWVVLFDQDSEPNAGCVEALRSAFLDLSLTQKLAIMVPSYWDVARNHTLPPRYTADGNLKVALTSGSLIDVEVFEEEGLFDESFFIDCVDFEFCLRIRDHGWIIAECKDAILLHRPAYPTEIRIFGRTFPTSGYSPLRRYYRTRNILWLLRRYWKRHFTLCRQLMWSNFKDVIKAAAEDNGRKKLQSAFSGYIDGVKGSPRYSTP